MIAQLRGQVETIGLTHLVIDVGGVGYLVMASSRTLQSIPPVGSSIRLFIQTQVREDSIELFGFVDENARDLFNMLLTVQGVGTRVALAIHSALSSEEVVKALQNQDKALLTQAEGVGPKLAARLVMELKDKVGSVATSQLDALLPIGTQATPILEDTIGVLVRLGYRRPDALRVVSLVLSETPDAGVEDLVKASLNRLTRG